MCEIEKLVERIPQRYLDTSNGYGYTMDLVEQVIEYDEPDDVLDEFMYLAAQEITAAFFLLEEADYYRTLVPAGATAYHLRVVLDFISDPISWGVEGNVLPPLPMEVAS